ncbi:MAG: 2-oxoacid:acceptor oxidoreductase family protein [Candidatus Bipolaricaulota bacterium]
MSRGCDIVLVGVGGQGVLTIGELLLKAALARGVPASFAPTKGMAQRGGFVKAELRIGRDAVGPRIAAQSADLVLATERSEALRGIGYVRPGGAFLLYDDVWEPTGVQLGRARYPTLDDVVAAVGASGATPIVLLPSKIPAVGGRPAAANVVLLGAACTVAALAAVLDPADVEAAVAARWPRARDANVAAFRLGLEAAGAR